MREVDIDQVAEAHAEGATVVDVREVREYVGFDARSVAGGTTAWIRPGRPVVEGREPGEVPEASNR